MSLKSIHRKDLQKRTVSRLIAMLLVFSAVSPLFSQSYYFRHYQVENGLSNNSVICSLQDKDGFMWFGTKDGLNRFDGSSFKVFRSSESSTAGPGNNFIHCLHQDASGIIWAGTESGLYSYNPATEAFTLFRGTEGAPVFDVCSDSAGNLWFIASYKLYRYHKSSNQTDIYGVNPGFDPSTICVSPNGTVWVGTGDGWLLKYEAERDTFRQYDLFSHSQKPISRWISKVYADASNNILAGTANQGVKLFDVVSSGYKDVLTYNADKTEIFARNFIQTAPHIFWVATESGIFILNSATGTTRHIIKNYGNPYSLSDNAVYTFSKDREGGIWAGTYFGGINYYSPTYSSFEKIFPNEKSNSLTGNVVREIHEDNHHNLWIGTEDAGLNKYDPSTGTFTLFAPDKTNTSLSYTNIHGLLVDGNELWVGTFEHGLDVLDIATGKRIRHYKAGSGRHDLNSNFIYTLSKIGTQEIAIGTTRGAFFYNRASNDFDTMPGMPLHNWYTCLFKDSRGMIWAGTYGNGVRFFNAADSTAGNFRYDAYDKHSIGSDRVNSIFEDSRGNLWFTTENGLCLFNRKQNNFTRYTVSNGFPSNFMLSMLEDEEQKLWISTTGGLVCFDATAGQTTTYTKENGLLSDQFNFNSACKDSKGAFYFGSVKGMIRFQPSAISKSGYKPPVYITGIQAANEEITTAAPEHPLLQSILYTDTIVLPYNQSTLNISFASLSYTAPEKLQYAYKMEGLDKEWIYLSSNRKAYFTHLSPGSYVFLVKATNSSGVWNGVARRLHIVVLPPWWQSTPAYFVYGIVLIFFMAWLLSSYHKRTVVKQQKQMRDYELAKEKEVLEAKIDFFTNVAHEIRTPLTLIKGPLEKVMRKAGDIKELSGSLTIMEKNTNRLVELTNQLLDFRQTEIKGFMLTFAPVDITALLHEMHLHFKPLAEQKEIEFKMELPHTDVTAVVDEDAIKKIISNLFSNAIKYAQCKVWVALSLGTPAESCFRIEFQNDGYIIPNEMKNKIFEPFFRLPETAKQKGTGIGLALSQSLALLHKGSIELQETQSAMNIFVFRMPLQQETGTKVMTTN